MLSSASISLPHGASRACRAAHGAASPLLLDRELLLDPCLIRCPPCRSFTPELASVYQQLKADGKSIEVVFVSYDRDEDSFEAYFKKMPWLSLPRGSPCEKHLTSEWNVQGIPRLVVVGSDGRILNSNARQAVSKNGAAGFPWQQDSNEEESPASFTIYMILFAVLSWLAGYAWRNGYFDPILNSIGMGRS